MAGLSELRAPSPFLPLSQRQPSKLSTPEYTVELKGASLTWAPKDKSSKKNVLEVSCGGGEKRGLTGGLGPKLGKPQEGGSGESWSWNSQGSKPKLPPPQRSVHSISGIMDSAVSASGALFTNPWTWRVVRNRGSVQDATLSCLEGQPSAQLLWPETDRRLPAPCYFL